MTGPIEVSGGTLKVRDAGQPNGIFSSNSPPRTWQVDPGAVLSLGHSSAGNIDNYVIDGGLMNNSATDSKLDGQSSARSP